MSPSFFLFFLLSSRAYKPCSMRHNCFFLCFHCCVWECRVNRRQRSDRRLRNMRWTKKKKKCDPNIVSTAIVCGAGEWTGRTGCAKKPIKEKAGSPPIYSLAIFADELIYPKYQRCQGEPRPAKTLPQRTTHRPTMVLLITKGYSRLNRLSLRLSPLPHREKNNLRLMDPGCVALYPFESVSQKKKPFLCVLSL